MSEDTKRVRKPSDSLARRDTIRAASQRGSRKLQNKRKSVSANGERPEIKPGELAHIHSPAVPATATAASVFVAYAREDIAAVGKLVARLRRNGASVTWDQDFAAGVQVRQTIKTAIEGAEAVIVVWSEASAKSLFVMDEADWALRESKLVPTHVAGFDPLEVPVGFGQIQTVPIDVPGQVESSLKAHGVLLD